MAFDKNSKMFFLSAIDNLPDPLRDTKWRLLIPSDIFKATGIKVSNGVDFGIGEAGTDDFALHIDAAEIPEQKLNTDKINWMGFNSSYVTGADISGEIKFTAKHLEDLRVWEAMTAWMNSLYNTGILVNQTGNSRLVDTGLALGLGAHKDINNPTSMVLRNNSIRIEMYNWMRGEVVFSYRLINAMPTMVGGWSLQHSDQAKLLTFDFTLHYDRPEVIIASPHTTGLL